MYPRVQKTSWTSQQISVALAMLTFQHACLGWGISGIFLEHWFQKGAWPQLQCSFNIDVTVQREIIPEFGMGYHQCACDIEWHILLQLEPVLTWLGGPNLLIC